ncbi:hemicentin-1-like, partial [Saccoglossus kowalevskii]|uniref:Hemicentin-1-like n=1 Tax=Saccoglossus kowalevskii TaxID=10224 RepID=A0ABM0MIL5_SACKO
MPIVTLNPASKEAGIGDTVFVTCTATGNPSPSSVQWYFNGVTMVPDTRYVVSSSSSTSSLTIYGLQRNDFYRSITCRATNSIGTRTVYFSLTSEPTTTIPTTTVDDSIPLDGYPTCTSTGVNAYPAANREGNYVTITCESRGGEPPSQLQWSRDYQDVNDNYYTDIYNKRWTSTYSLTLDKDDNGITFTCTETHPRLYFPRTCTIGPINVQYMPIVTLNPASKEAGIGDTVFSTCTATGNPLPSSVEWYFNGATMVPDTRYVVSSSASTSSLTIYGLQRNDFDKSITCRATNTIGTRTVYFSLTSEPTTTIPTTTVDDSIPLDGYPTCTSTGVNAYPAANREGNYVTITCDSRGGEPPSQLQWSRDDQDVNDNYYTDIYNKRWTSTYSLTLDKDDNGITFTCTETHPRLYFPRTCTIGPINVQYMPIVTLNPASKEAGIGDTVFSTCTATGNPLPSSVQWYFNGVTMVPDTRYVVSSSSSTSSLTIYGLQRNDFYRSITCRATNSIGTRTVYFSLTSEPTTTIPTTTVDDSIPLDGYPTCTSTGVNAYPAANREGNYVTITCESRGGEPPSQLQWSRDYQDVNDNYYTDIYNKRWTSTYSLTLDKDDNGITFTCTETHPRLYFPRTCTIGPINVQYMPIVTLNPASKEAGIGDTVFSTCTATGNPLPSSVEWYFNGATMVPDTRYVVSSSASTSSLTIYGLQRNDFDKSITCRATNTIGTRTVYFSLTSEPTTTIPTTTVDDSIPLDGYPTCTSTGVNAYPAANREGNYVTITCDSRGGEPPSQLQWSRDDQDVNDNYYTDIYNKRWTSTYSLTLDKDDNGITFTCTETHPRLYFPRTCTIGPINVQYMPIVTLNPASKEAGIGDTVFSTCTATGNPAPSSVQWYFNGVTMVPDTRYVVSSSSSTSSLTIYGLQRNDFYWSITCRATNSIGTRTVYFSLTSEPTTTIPTTTVDDSIPLDGYPTCTSTGVNAYPAANREGNYVTITCESRGGEPPSQLQWSRDDQDVNDNYYTDIYNKRWTSTYSLTLDKDDNGITFTCTETHPRLYFPRTCTIGPINVQYMPIVTLNPASKEAGIGDTVFVTCTATGNPLPSSVQWYFNGVTMVPETRYVVSSSASTSSLTIYGLQRNDFDQSITCRATNSIGTRTVYFSLTSEPTTTIPTTTVDDSIPLDGYPTCTSTGVNAYPAANREGNYVTITCESRGGEPPSQLQWSRDYQDVNDNYYTDIYNKRWTSTYSLTLDKDDNGITFTCTETHPRLYFPRTCTIGPINVQYMPIVTLNPASKEAGIGDTVFSTCTATGNPLPSSVEWYFNGATMVPDTRYVVSSSASTSSLTIYGLQRNDFDQSITCRATNTIGTRTVYFSLTSEPTTTIPTTTVDDSIPLDGYPTCTSTGVNAYPAANREGNYVTITCDSRGGEPPSQLQWSRDDQDVNDNYYTDIYNKRWTSTYSLTLDKDENGITFTCTETHPRLYFPRTCTIGPINVQYMPIVTLNPASKEAGIGDTVFVTCTATGNPSPFSVQWYFNGVTMVPDTRYVVSSSASTSSLTIYGLQRNDFDQSITCRATNSIGTRTVYFSLTSEPTTTIPTTTVDDSIPLDGYPTCTSTGVNAYPAANREGNYVTITCESRGGEPPSQLQWSRDYQDVNDNYYTDTYNKRWTSTYSLTLDKDDNGITFTCTETHPRLYFPRTCTIGPINVQYMPIVTLNPASKEAGIGDTVFSTCTATGNPLPSSVEWYFNGATMVPDTRYVVSSSASTSSLTIYGLQRNDFDQSITCRATNSIGTRTVYFSLTSEPTTTIPTTTVDDSIPLDGYPTCTSTGVNAYPAANREGNYVTITCESRGGEPPSQLQWSRDDQDVNDNYYTDIFNKRWTSTYSLTLDKDDNGITFSCTETHPRLYFPRTCTIGPINVQYMPIVTLNPASKEAGIGDTVFSTCTATGNPAPSSVQWYFNGVTMVPDTRYVVSSSASTSSLTIYGLQRNDFYRSITCRATNSIGTRTEYFSLTSEPTSTIPTTTVDDSIPLDGYPTCTSTGVNAYPAANREGNYVTITCESRGGEPPSQLQWSHDYQDVNDYYYTDTYNKRWTSTYSLTLDKDDNGITFTCTETHPRLYFPRTCTIGPINVQYMPIVTLNPT